MNLRIVTVFLLAVSLAACKGNTKPDANAEANGGANGGSVSGAGQNGAITPGSPEEFMTVVGDRVFFATDKYDLSPEAKTTIQAQATWLQRYGNKTVTVEGHADERGTREYNIAIGERRANAIKDSLIADGVPANRIKVVSFGKERPTCGESNEACWGKNRRGVTVVE